MKRRVVKPGDVVTETSGTKLDRGKPMMGLMSSKWLLGTADILTFGAQKYESHNWRKGLTYSRLYDALQRHLAAWNDGEENDPETGKSHLLHASCCLMFLYEMSVTRQDMDDRYKPKVTRA